MFCADRLEKRITDRSVAEQLAPMLIIHTAPFQPSELIERSWSIVSQFMKLDKSEAKYIASIQQGELYPELLFSQDQEEGKRMSLHPAILWKMLNVRAQLAKGKTNLEQRPPDRNQT
jgi:hypothetical protein